MRVCAGVYQCVDRDTILELWFERAKFACDKIRNNYIKNVEFYTEELHKQAIFQEKLIKDIHDAIEKNHLVVYYQPQFNIQGNKPRLSSAEALIRWNHPELGMISPGEFIPQFESNGLIRKIDSYVLRQTAKQMCKWIRKIWYFFPNGC